jgi:hypothetical protein
MRQEQPRPTEHELKLALIDLRIGIDQRVDPAVVGIHHRVEIEHVVVLSLVRRRLSDLDVYDPSRPNAEQAAFPSYGTDLLEPLPLASARPRLNLRYWFCPAARMAGEVTTRQ